MTIHVRFFAAAREAAGIPEVGIEAATVSALLDSLERRFGERMGRVLGMSTLLLDGRRCDGVESIPDGSVVDVLPPFAGG